MFPIDVSWFSIDVSWIDAKIESESFKRRYDTHNMNLTPDIQFLIAVLANGRDRMDGLDDLPMAGWLFCKPSGESRYSFFKGDNLVSTIDLEDACLDMQHLLGIVVVGGDEPFQEFKKKWAAALPSAEIVLRRVPQWAVKDILRAGMDCVTDHLARQLEECGRGALDMATYRREFDRLQRKFARLEEYVSRQSFQSAMETFEYSPNESTLTEVGRKVKFEDISKQDGRSLIQSLPVDSLGLSGISLYLSVRPEAETEPLCVTLRAIETGEVFAEWWIRGSAARSGWTELALNCAIDQPALTLTLAIDWPGAESGWALALGPPHPYKDFCAQIEGGGYFDAPLAMRLFSNLPGVRLAATTSAIRPRNALHAMSQFVPMESYGAVVQVLPPLRESAATVVFYDKEIGCVTVHPFAGGLAAARMRVIVPKHTWGISAQIHLAHERASATDFAMMVCSVRNEGKELGRLGQVESPSSSFSGWKRLLPLEAGSISVVLPVSADEQLSLHLVTRQTPDASPDFAWARFSRLEFNILPEFLAFESASDAFAPVAQEPESAVEEYAAEATGE